MRPAGGFYVEVALGTAACSDLGSCAAARGLEDDEGWGAISCEAALRRWRLQCYR